MKDDATPNFASILDESPTEVRAPALLPVGMYLARVGQYERVDNPPNGMKPYVNVPFTILAAGEDVDEDALEAAGGIKGQVLYRKYWATPDAAVFIDQFQLDCGVDFSVRKTCIMRFDDCINAEVLVVVSHGMNKAGTRTFANVERTLPAD